MGWVEAEVASRDDAVAVYSPDGTGIVWSCDPEVVIEEELKESTKRQSEKEL